jgi:serine/threonine protein kinase
MCGHFPFSYLPNRQNEIVAGKFRHSEEWNSLSSSAKDLISSILQVDPLHRLSLEEILSHPWILREEDSISSEPMGEKYVNRLRKLTESERVYHELKDEEGFISKEKILQALNLIIPSGESNVPSPHEDSSEQPHTHSEHKITPQLAEAQQEVVEEHELEMSRRTHVPTDYDEETLEELLTQVTNRSNDPMNHETFVHFFILSTLTLVKKRRRTEEDAL